MSAGERVEILSGAVVLIHVKILLSYMNSEKYRIFHQIEVYISNIQFEYSKDAAFSLVLVAFSSVLQCDAVVLVCE